MKLECEMNGEKKQTQKQIGFIFRAEQEATREASRRLTPKAHPTTMTMRNTLAIVLQQQTMVIENL